METTSVIKNRSKRVAETEKGRSSMTDYKSLIQKIEYFYIDIVEEFRETEQQIMNDSQFRSIFRKKDYDGNAAHLNQCRNAAQNISINGIAIDDGDESAEEVARRFIQAVTSFRNLCDAHIQLQMLLKRKAQKEKIGFLEYKESYDKMNRFRQETNRALRDLDIVYTDYTEEHDYYGKGAGEKRTARRKTYGIRNFDYNTGNSNRNDNPSDPNPILSLIHI